MIQVQNLTKEFKTYKKYEGLKGAFKSFFSHEYTIKRAVDNLSFNVEKGEMVGYIGVNGAGKSTTIKMLAGILVPSSGQCLVNGIVPYKKRIDNAKNIGVVFGQRTQLWWDLPVSESFGILQKIYQVPKKDFDENLAYFKELLGLNEFYTTPVRNLSLGQKMRCDLTASLLHNPKVVYLDEPTIGLDILVKDKIRKAIRQINGMKNTTVILTTHDLDDIEEICERIVVIDQGKLIYDGSIDAMKRKYGIQREVRFALSEGAKPDCGEIARTLKIKPDDSVFSADENELTIRFHRDELEAARVISTVVQRITVRDIFIEEVSMEEIVKQIYSGAIRMEAE